MTIHRQTHPDCSRGWPHLRIVYVRAHAYTRAQAALVPHRSTLVQSEADLCIHCLRKGSSVGCALLKGGMWKTQTGRVDESKNALRLAFPPQLHIMHPRTANSPFYLHFKERISLGRNRGRGGEAWPDYSQVPLLRSLPLLVLVSLDVWITLVG